MHPDQVGIRTEGSKLELILKIDSKVKCNVRISLCVTEERNENNIPLMLYTPTKEDYV